MFDETFKLYVCEWRRDTNASALFSSLPFLYSLRHFARRSLVLHLLSSFFLFLTRSPFSLSLPLRLVFPCFLPFISLGSLWFLPPLFFFVCPSPRSPFSLSVFISSLLACCLSSRSALLVSSSSFSFAVCPSPRSPFSLSLPLHLAFCLSSRSALFGSSPPLFFYCLPFTTLAFLSVFVSSSPLSFFFLPFISLASLSLFNPFPF